MMKEIFFKDWESLYHVAISAVLSFLTLFAFVRITGKRTLAKLNAFDFVVTVALGSTLSFTILAEVTLSEGALALAIIIGMQYLLAGLARKSGILEKVINSKPTLLFYNGEFLEDGMARELLTHEEILSQIRKFRIEHLEDVRAVVMELNGEITVIAKSDGKGKTSLSDIENDKIDL